MATLIPISQCVGCDNELYPNLIAPKVCFHVICIECMTMWLSKGQDCPIGREQITSIKDCSPLKTYLDTFARCVKENYPRVKQELDKIGTKDISTECSICNNEEFLPIYYHDGIARFWHEECLKARVPEPKLQPLYPQHIVQVAQALSEKVEPIPHPEKPIDWSEKRSFIKGVVVTLAVISFCAFIINRLSPQSRNPFLFVLGLPFWIVEKFLLVIAAGLKLILAEEQ